MCVCVRACVRACVRSLFSNMLCHVEWAHVSAPAGVLLSLTTVNPMLTHLLVGGRVNDIGRTSMTTLRPSLHSLASAIAQGDVFVPEAGVSL